MLLLNVFLKLLSNLDLDPGIAEPGGHASPFPDFWLISLPYLNQGGQTMPPTFLPHDSISQ